MTEIRGFRGQYAFLSNFEPAVIRVRGVRYPTVEHAFQACKTENLAERAVIAGLPTPAEARQAGQQVTLRPGWDDLKEEVMLATAAREVPPARPARAPAGHWRRRAGGRTRLAQMDVLLQARDGLRAGQEG